jgi:hypothetical protein
VIPSNSSWSSIMNEHAIAAGVISPSLNVALSLATQIAGDAHLPDSGEQASVTSIPIPRARYLAGAATSPHLGPLADLNLSSEIIGYLDRNSQLNFASASRETFNTVQRLNNLFVSRFEHLSLDKREALFRKLLDAGQFFAPQTRALMALGEGQQELADLRSTHAQHVQFVGEGSTLPFAHWCLEKAIESKDPLALQLAMTMSDTDVNAKRVDDPWEETPLYSLVCYSLLESRADIIPVVKALITSLLSNPTVDVNAASQTPTGDQTVLMGAMLRRHTFALEALSKHPALDWNATDSCGRTALHLATTEYSGHGRLHMLQPYLKYMNINATDMFGDTPLHIAVQACGSDPENIRILLAAGADPSIRNNDNMTAYDVAVDAESTLARDALTAHLGASRATGE